VPNVSTQPAWGIKQTSFSLVSHIETNGVSYQAGFEWGTSATLATYFTTLLFGSDTTTGNFMKGLGNLTCNTTYYYRAIAVLTSGRVVRGGIVAVTTLPC
jgi:hypothetical protein